MNNNLSRETLTIEGKTFEVFYIYKNIPTITPIQRTKYYFVKDAQTGQYYKWNKNKNLKATNRLPYKHDFGITLENGNQSLKEIIKNEVM